MTKESWPATKEEIAAILRSQRFAEDLTGCLFGLKNGLPGIHLVRAELDLYLWA